MLVIVCGRSVLGLDYNYNDHAKWANEPSDLESEEHKIWSRGNDKLTHLTVIFNIFMFLQYWNEINCRKVGRRDFNILEGLFDNQFYVIIMVGQIAS